MIFGVAASVAPPADSSEFALIARLSEPENGVLALTGLDLTSYQTIAVVVDGLQAPDTGPTTLGMRLSVDGVIRASGYRYQKEAYDSANGGGTLASQSASQVALTSYVVDGSYSGSWTIRIANVASALWKIMTIDDARVTDDPLAHRGVGSGLLEQTGTVDGVVLFPGASGLLTAGSVAVYGIKTGPRSAGPVGLVSSWVGALS